MIDLYEEFINKTPGLPFYLVNDCKDFMESIKIAESLINDDSVYQIYILVASWKCGEITSNKDFKIMQQSLQRSIPYMFFDGFNRSTWVLVDELIYKYKDKRIYVSASFVNRESPQLLIRYKDMKVV